MSTTAIFRCGVHFYSQVNQDNQLTQVVVRSPYQNVKFTSGYVNGATKNSRADESAETVDLPQLMIRCWTNQDKTVLEAVDIQSKQKAPFEVVVTQKNTPPIDKKVNERYLDIFRKEMAHGFHAASAELKKNPTEFPMIPYEQLESVGYKCKLSSNDPVDFRAEVAYAKECAANSFFPQ